MPPQFRFDGHPVSNVHAIHIEEYMLRIFAVWLTMFLFGGLAARPAAADDKLFLTLKAGTVVIKLRPDLAPKHVERYTTLAREGFDDGQKWHRVIDGFVAQTGDPTGIGTEGAKLPYLQDEISKEPIRRGTVGAANKGPNTATSQFFICLDDGGCSSLTGRYSIWGQVVEGIELVDKLKRGTSRVVDNRFVAFADADIVVKARVASTAEIATATPAVKKDEPVPSLAAKSQPPHGTDCMVGNISLASAGDYIDACTRSIDLARKQRIPGADLAKIYARRAMALKAQNRLDAAITDFTESLENSRDQSYHKAIGQVYIAKREFQKALESINSFKSSKPDEEQYLGRAQALEGLGRKQEAIAAYEKYEAEFGRPGIIGAWARQTANEALIRLGARKAPDPPPSILTRPSAVPWKRQCAERRERLDNTQAKAAGAAERSDQAGVCALTESLSNLSWLYCSCAADDGSTSRQMDCFKELAKPGETLKTKFNCPR